MSRIAKSNGVSKVAIAMSVVIIVLISALVLSLSGSLGVKNSQTTTITETLASTSQSLSSSESSGAASSPTTISTVNSQSNASGMLTNSTNEAPSSSSSQTSQTSVNFTSVSLWCADQAQKYGQASVNASSNPIDFTNVSLFQRGDPGSQNVSLFSLEWQIPNASAPPLYCLNVFVNGSDLGFAQATQSNATGGAGSFVDTPVGNITIVANRDYNVTLTALFPDSYYVSEFTIEAQVGYPT